jgi:hypothetical protein
MALVAWAPSGMLAPIELLAVNINSGPVNESDWLGALADRVTELAIKAGAKATRQACRGLGLPETENPSEAGQYLVLGNWNLKTHLNLTVIDESPFPANAEENEHAREAIDITDFESWVEQASLLVRESGLD